MDPRIEELAGRLEGLTGELAQIKARLDRIEGRATAVQRPPSLVSGAPAADQEGPLLPVRLTSSAVGLIGRTLVVLGGAYLLRAVTESAVIPAAVGVGVGLVYMAVWLALADRSGRLGQQASALFHGVAAAMIGFPLVWEAATRFALLGPAAASLALLLLLVAGLLVSERRRLREVAWANVLFALGTSIALLQATRQPLVLTGALLALAALVEVFTFRDRWPSLRWPVALVLDFSMLLTLVIVTRPGGPPVGYPALSPGAVVFVGLGIPFLYLLAIAARTLVRRKTVRPFDVGQGVIALVMGLGGAIRIAAAHTAVGGAAVLLGLGCYLVAFTILERRERGAEDFYVYTTFAVLLTGVGTQLMLSGGPLTLVWAGLGLAAAWLGGRHGRATLVSHAFIYLGGAASLGWLGPCVDGLIGSSASPWRELGTEAVALVLATAAAWMILAMMSRRPDVPESLHIPRAGVAALMVLGLAGIAARSFAGLIGTPVDAAVLAAGRTTILATLAVLLAWGGRRGSLPELVWLVYPVLVGGGAKLLLEDLRHGRPVTLFVSFALYGCALLLTPRLLRES